MADEKSSLLQSGSQRIVFSRKLILLTGGNSGIGLQACKVLCSKGHKVITTVRSEEKGQHCLKEVRHIYPQADIHYMTCELTDPNSIKQFVDKFRSTWLSDGETLDVLVNNAGVSPPNSPERTMNPYYEQREISMSVNCIAPILLTDLLLNDLKETVHKKGEARVVMVNSGIILQDIFLPYYTRPDDPMLTKPGSYIHGGQAYKNSKAALMMCTLALADELRGSGVLINSLCPGEVFSTNISRHLTSCERCFFRCMFGCFLRCCMQPQNIHQGGGHVVALTVGEKGESHGLFFVKGDMKQPSPQCMDKKNQINMLKVIRDYTQDQRS